MQTTAVPHILQSTGTRRQHYNLIVAHIPYK